MSHRGLKKRCAVSEALITDECVVCRKAGPDPTDENLLLPSGLTAGSANREAENKRQEQISPVETGEHAADERRSALHFSDDSDILCLAELLSVSCQSNKPDGVPSEGAAVTNHRRRSWPSRHDTRLNNSILFFCSGLSSWNQLTSL